MSSGGDTGATLPVSVYVHVPFCLSKCAYCDFFSEPAADGAVMDRYVAGVLREVEARADLLRDVPTLYLGGGTPTALGERLVGLVAGIRERPMLREDAEVTVETNPETTDGGLVEELVAAGVSRFSLGVQSLDDAVLATLGRRHDAARAVAACSTLVRAGTPFSIDLICGVPGQTIDSWRETLDQAASTGAGHVSVYPLSLEEGTPLASAVAAGRAEAPDPDLAADMMLLACDSMARRGMDRYEVASYAGPGQESRHNLVYWTGGAYLGVGPGAASMLPAASCGAAGLEPPPDAARCRFCAVRDREAFGPRDQVEWLTAAEAAREDVMLGMRLVRGVPADRVESAGLSDALSELEGRGLVETWSDGRGVECWRTTDRGWLLGNEVFGRIWEG